MTTEYDRASPEEVSERVDLCYQCLLVGWTQAQIVNHCYTTKGWDLTKRQLRTYVHRAQELLRDEAKSIDRRAEFSKALRRYELLYRRALGEEDTKGAAAMQDRIVGLLNLASQPALELDWRDELLQLGVNPSEIFERLIKELADAKENEA